MSGLRHLGRSALGGRCEGLQVVGTGSRAFVAHLFSAGFTEVDLADPRDPRVLSFTPAPPGSWSIHLQVQGDLLLVANGPDMWSRPEDFDPGRSLFHHEPGFSAGVRVYDVSRRGEPREIGFLDLGGGGVHRAWFDGSPLAFVSAVPPGQQEAVLVVLDLSTPSHPLEVDRWWIPGMAPGEEASRDWPDHHRVSLHHATASDGHVYGAWRDGGLSVQQVDVRGVLGEATRLVWPGPAAAGSAVHTALRLPGTSLLAAAEEGLESEGEPQRRVVALVDVRDPTAPRRVGALPRPRVTPVPGARFGPHNLYEYRPEAWLDGRVVFSAHQGAGLRVYRLSVLGEAREVAHFLPDPPRRLLDPRPARAAVAQTNDVFVTADGLVVVVDANTGLDVLELDLGA